MSVVGGSPSWRRGMGSILEEGGFAVVAYESLSDWTPGAGGAAILTHTEEEEIERSIRNHVANYPHIPILAVMREPGLAAVAHLIRLGSAAVLDDGDDECVFPQVVDETLNGRSSMSLHMVRSMAEHVPRHYDTASWINDQERDWLRWMALGETVAEIAERVGYSERAMFRLLRKLYVRIGVTNRTEALLWASRNGVLNRSEAQSGSSQ